MARMWDPKNVQIGVSGTKNNQDGIVTGFADDSMVEGEKNEDNVMPYVSVKGEASMAKNADDTGTITIHLSSNSPWIYKFSRIAHQKEGFKLNITNRNIGGVGLSSTDAFVIKSPDMNVGKEVEEQEITIWVEKYIPVATK